MKPWLVASVFVVVAGLAAPAAAQNKREMQMMADIRMLQEQTQQLQQQMQSAITTLTDALKAINTRIDDQSNATRKAFADQKLVVDELNNNLRVIKERVDDSNVRIGSLSQEVEALRLAIPQYPAAPPPPSSTFDLSPSGTPTSVPPSSPSSLPMPTTPAAAPAPTPTGPGVTPQRMFETSWADYTSGQWELCVGGFEQYIRTFPKSEMAGEAQNYIGECNFQAGKFPDAVAAYERVISTYPRSTRVPEAIYKRGLALERLGQTDRARESYEQVMKNFPDTEAARLAKQNLARLSRGRP